MKQIIKLSELMTALEAWMPLGWQESYDNSGLVLGNSEQEISRALLCVDVSDEVLEEAIEKDAQLIISHHPPIFGGLKKLDFQTPLGKRIQKAVKHDIAWYSMHTNLDNGMEGVNKYLADKLQIEERRFLRLAAHSQSAEGALAHGSGLIGSLAVAMSETALLELLKEVGGKGCVRHSALKNRSLKKIAICGGSGNFLIPDALHQQADVFITGELKYHDFTDADPRLWLIDFGHYESERHTKDIIYTYITKKFPAFAVEISTRDRNSISYL